MIKRLNLDTIVKDIITMSMLTDAENNYIYDMSEIKPFESSHITNTVLRVNLQATREEQYKAVDELIEFLGLLNEAFNRSAGIPEDTKLFKVTNKKARYAGNNTICVFLSIMTCADDRNSRTFLDVLTNKNNMFFNVFGTNKRYFDIIVTDGTTDHTDDIKMWPIILKKVI